VRFDNVAAQQSPAKPNCTSPGIHYVGTTDTNTAVCFTLTPDGKRLLEIGFGASTSCSGRSSSTLVDNKFEGVLPELGTHGRIDEVAGIPDKQGNEAAAFLFRGNITGAAASGVISNRGFCDSLKVRWTARRLK
jgi:hypothetical protein